MVRVLFLLILVCPIPPHPTYPYSNICMHTHHCVISASSLMPFAIYWWYFFYLVLTCSCWLRQLFSTAPGGTGKRKTTSRGSMRAYLLCTKLGQTAPTTVFSVFHKEPLLEAYSVCSNTMASFSSSLTSAFWSLVSCRTHTGRNTLVLGTREYRFLVFTSPVTRTQ